MRITLFFLILFTSLSLFGSESKESLSIEFHNGKYSISYINFTNEVMQYFEKKKLQGGGYTWEALIRAGFEIDAADSLSQIEFDPEGDGFHAYTGSEVVANKAKQIITKLSSNLNYRERCLKRATEQGYIE